MKKVSNMYSGIDMEKTGQHLKKLISQHGYKVKDIQKFLGLSCPQPVYRWFGGRTLPSVDHLFSLSRLLHVHMEELLVAEGDVKFYESLSKEQRRIYVYWEYLHGNEAA